MPLLFSVASVLSVAFYSFGSGRRPGCALCGKKFRRRRLIHFQEHPTANVTIGKGSRITQTKTEQKRLNPEFFLGPRFSIIAVASIWDYLYWTPINMALSAAAANFLSHTRSLRSLKTQRWLAL